MNRAIVVKIFRISLAGVLIFGLSAPGYSMYVANYSEKSFEEPGAQTALISSTAASETIKNLIIKSATYFLKGKSNIDLLTSKLEGTGLEEICFSEMQMIVDNALNDMNTAQYYYQTLKNRADNTPYNQEIINKLVTFDYNSLANEYGMNVDILRQVKGYLQAGNVRGTYTWLLIQTGIIINKLEKVQNEIYNLDFPKSSTIWKLNQDCAHMHLFGQYIAQIFYEL
jgi:hypothetical protein